MAASGNSKNLKQGVTGQTKKRNISEAHQTGANFLAHGIDPLQIGQGPTRRSQSKNDKYKEGEAAISLSGLH